MRSDRVDAGFSRADADHFLDVRDEDLAVADAAGLCGLADGFNRGLDGIVAVGDELLISSWPAKTIYPGKPGGEFKEAFTDLEAPADIGFDSKRNRVLVPRFQGSFVEAWDVK